MSTIPPFAAEARAAYGAYCAFGRRMSPLLVVRLTAMREYASARSHTPSWNETAEQLSGAVATVCTAAMTRRRSFRRMAVDTVLIAIVAFEKTHARSLPYDDHGRYHPEPGTEYPISVSDIGRAAVQILGPTWHAESLPWGVGASIRENDATTIYSLYVDEDGDLYLADGSSREFFTDAVITDGLAALAALVTEAVRTRREAEKCPSGQTRPECTETDPCEQCGQHEDDSAS